MRALTVRQPWAWAIVHGGKDVENRSRNAAGGYRGPIAIHAGLREDDDAYADDLIKAAFAEYDDSWQLLDEMPMGVVLGVVDLIDVHTSHSAQTAHGCCRSWWGQDLMTHLVLGNPRPLARPVPAKGRLGLWTPPAEVLTEITRQLEETP